MAEKTKLTAAIAIASIAVSFRRCGLVFTREPQHFAADYFNDDELLTLKAEPNLKVAEVEVDPEEVAVLPRPEGKPKSKKADDDKPADQGTAKK
tara:strand:- start:6865 stop:7146 length:282 start_codon:yes stop_codon:yes gene_type:complete